MYPICFTFDISHGQVLLTLTVQVNCTRPILFANHPAHQTCSGVDFHRSFEYYSGIPLRPFPWTFLLFSHVSQVANLPIVKIRKDNIIDLRTQLQNIYQISRAEGNTPAKDHFFLSNFHFFHNYFILYVTWGVFDEGTRTLLRLS